MTPASEPVLTVSLIGGMRILTPAGKALRIKSKKARALMAYLLMAPQMRDTRGRLAALLWEDADDAHGRASLRQAVAALRQGLKDDDETYVLAGDRETLGLRSENFRCDALDIDNGAGSNVRGEFLSDLAGLSEPFEDWRRCEAARIESQLETAPAAKGGKRTTPQPDGIHKIRSGARARPSWILAASLAVAACVTAFLVLKNPARDRATITLVEEPGVSATAEPVASPPFRWQLEPEWRRQTAKARPELREAIAQCRRDQPDSETIITACTKLISALGNENPLRSSAFVNRATAHRWNGEYEASIADLENAFAADPAHYNALHGMAYNYFLIGDYQKALDFYARVRMMQPKHFMAIYRTGETYFAMDEYEKAADAFTQAIKDKDDSASSYLYRGRAYAALGRIGEAKRDFMKAATMEGEVRRDAEEAYAALLRRHDSGQGGEEIDPVREE